ncbi:MAG: DEAD/DEAH box helicase [Flavobacteriales bacterium]|nr:DEAD/DEAH box helicase [Flavobacteriales bacterium]
MTTFNDMNLTKPLREALEEMGYTTPTTIQQKAFGPITGGQNVLGIAQTGTGKTYAYLLPILREWKFASKQIPTIIIIVPTRELVVQVIDEFERLAKFTNMVITGAYGGANIKSQMSDITAGVDVVVATPGRLLDLMLNGTISSRHIKKLVIDEVDEMLNLGFRTQLQNLLDLLPLKKQTLMFSATITEEIEEWIHQNLTSPIRIEAASTGTPLKNITQIGYLVPNYNTKINLLIHLLETDSEMTKVLVFAGSKRLADDVNDRMELDFPDQLAVIHSNKSQNTRFKTVSDFEDGKSRILIASDLIARGIDVSSVSHVINMDLPLVPENYIHRIGRTGRADKTGIAISFITESDEKKLEKIEELMDMKIPIAPLPKGLEISTILTPDEQPSLEMSTSEPKRKKKETKGAAFHEKKEKNQKVNVKVTRADKMKQKYGKRYEGDHRR